MANVTVMCVSDAKELFLNGWVLHLAPRMGALLLNMIWSTYSAMGKASFAHLDSVVPFGAPAFDCQQRCPHRHTRRHRRTHTLPSSLEVPLSRYTRMAPSPAPESNAGPRRKSSHDLTCILHDCTIYMYIAHGVSFTFSGNGKPDGVFGVTSGA